MKKILTIALLPTMLCADNYLLQLEDKHYKSNILIEPVTEENVTPEEPQILSSCEDIYQSNNASVSGVFTVDNGSKEYSVYCHFENGGWTLVAAQFEDNPIDWNEGIQPDYAPDLSTRQSFTLNTSELPSHSRVLFEKIDSVGQAGFNGFNDWLNIQYTTGNIALSLISTTIGDQYYIHRDSNQFYGWHNPEEALYQNTQPEWQNTLTVDAYGRRGLSYAFSPNQNIQQARGFSWDGVDFHSTLESSAWVIWVR